MSLKIEAVRTLMGFGNNLTAICIATNAPVGNTTEVPTTCSLDTLAPRMSPTNSHAPTNTTKLTANSRIASFMAERNC